MKIKKTNNYLIITFDNVEEYLKNTNLIFETEDKKVQFRYFNKEFLYALGAIGSFGDAIHTEKYYTKTVLFPLNSEIVNEIINIEEKLKNISNTSVKIISFRDTITQGYTQIGDIFFKDVFEKHRGRYYALSNKYIDNSFAMNETEVDDARIVTRNPYIIHESTIYGTFSIKNMFYKLIIYGDNKKNMVIIIIAIIVIALLFLIIVYALVKMILRKYNN